MGRRRGRRRPLRRLHRLGSALGTGRCSTCPGVAKIGRMAVARRPHAGVGRAVLDALLDAARARWIASGEARAARRGRSTSARLRPPRPGSTSGVTHVECCGCLESCCAARSPSAIARRLDVAPLDQRVGAQSPGDGGGQRGVVRRRSSLAAIARTFPSRSQNRSRRAPAAGLQAGHWIARSAAAARTIVRRLSPLAPNA